MKRLVYLIVLGLLLVGLPALAAEIPPTIPHPGINPENGYSIGVEAIDIDARERRPFWQAPYLDNLPYVPNSGWLDGDRVGYHCAFGHLEHNGEIIGRFTFRVVDGADSYMKIGDRYMVEGSRYYNGGIFGGQQVPTGDCPFSTGNYETANVPDERPVIPFWHGDQVVEIRDYREVEVQSPGITFELLDPVLEPFVVSNSVDGSRPHVVNNRVGVLAREFGVPTIEVYYDALGSGSMFAPDDEPPDDGQPNPDDCNTLVSMSQGRQVYTGSPGGSSNAALEAATGEQWMFGGSGGKVLQWFTNAANWNTLGILHRCGTDAEIDRVVLIFDPREARQQNHMTQYLNQVLTIIDSRYPAAEAQFVMLVGAEGHVPCSPVVKAARTHAGRIAELNLHPNAGPDLDIPCSGYSDLIGHLNAVGAADANAQLGAFYSGG